MQKDNKALHELSHLLSFAVSESEEKALAILGSYQAKYRVFECTGKVIDDLAGDGGKCSEMLALVAALASRRVTDGFRVGRKYSEKEIESLIVALFIGCSVETVFSIAFDARGAYLGFDFISDGTVNYIDVLPRRVLELAKDRGAASLILAHNHPGGFCVPSSDDELSFKMMTDILRNCGIDVLANYVVAEGKCMKFPPKT